MPFRKWFTLWAGNLAALIVLLFAGSMSAAAAQANTIDCPGREEKQFLPGQDQQAKDWAAKWVCSRQSKCPQGRHCNKNVFIADRPHYIAARVMCVCAPPMTKARARGFWKDFDDHTLRGIGPHINQIYGNQGKYLADLNPVMEALDGCLELEIKEAHHQTPTDEEKKAQEDRVKKVIASGAVARLSKLQLDIMKDHFKNGDDVDFDDFQLAVEMFANGELRMPGQLGEREMNTMTMWFYWKCFAIIAGDNNIDKAAWDNILHSLEKGKEIYRRVYPAPSGSTGDDPRAELAGSSAARFDAAKQLSEEEKEKLRKEIDALSVDQVKQREKEELASMTVAKAEPCPRKEYFADVRPVRQGNGTRLEVALRVTDQSGNPVRGTSVWLEAREGGFELPAGSYLERKKLAGDENGSFRTSLIIPAHVLSVTLSAVESGCLAFATRSVNLRGPESIPLHPATARPEN